MRKAVEKHRFTFEGDAQSRSPSASASPACPNPAVKDATDLVSRADKALYQSKHGGRNRVTIDRS